MANITQLLALLGSQGAGGVGGVSGLPPGLTPGERAGNLPPELITGPMGTPIVPQMFPEEQGPDIEVTRPNLTPDNPMYSLIPREEAPVQVPQAPADTSMFPRTEASPQEIARSKPLEGLPQHKGLFGMKGTLRDVIGMIGDGLARNTNYSNRRLQEKSADAMTGFNSNDPIAVEAAIARVAQLNPELAMKLQNQAQEAQYRRATAETNRVKAEETSRRATNSQRIQKAKIIPGLMSQAKGNPDQQKAIMEWYRDPESSIDDIDPEIIAQSAINPYQRETLKDRDQQIGISQQNADANTTRANRPPAARSSNPTTASIAAPILNKIARGQVPTQGELETLDRVGMSQGRGRKSSAQEILSRRQGQARPSGAPPVGYKNKNGLTFRGGDPNDRKNWR